MIPPKVIDDGESESGVSFFKICIRLSASGLEESWGAIIKGQKTNQNEQPLKMTNYNERSLRLTNHDQGLKNMMNSKSQSFSKGKA